MEGYTRDELRELCGQHKARLQVDCRSSSETLYNALKRHRLLPSKTSSPKREPIPPTRKTPSPEKKPTPPKHNSPKRGPPTKKEPIPPKHNSPKREPVPPERKTPSPPTKNLPYLPSPKFKPSPRKLSPKAEQDVYLLVHNEQGEKIYFISFDKIGKLFQRLSPQPGETAQWYYINVLSANCRVKDSIDGSMFAKYDVIVSPPYEGYINVLYEKNGQKLMPYHDFNALVNYLASTQPLLL